MAEQKLIRVQSIKDPSVVRWIPENLAKNYKDWKPIVTTDDAIFKRDGEKKK